MRRSKKKEILKGATKGLQIGLRLNRAILFPEKELGKIVFKQASKQVSKKVKKNAKKLSKRLFG